MRSVWINRFDASGKQTQINKWELHHCKNEDTHVVHLLSGYTFTKLNSTANGHVGSTLCEHIANQRGDGWLYTEDGETPPDSYSLIVIRTKQIWLPKVIIGKDAQNYEITCWHPMHLPEFDKHWNDRSS
ncbi:hypothetical protein LVJ82_17190 [Vitreoscilla massiliensis]|uniref:Uncharacterized protein n=1 Tax=Vitreoscilla massiliensis TaxID=1689272 RepID=A0ABY4E089_9NEIS|nr:hypothetical protein [Vitreoscilla massiliensis]UOO89155.1 hypothetical protein LVJ82_17190 [Vitreoscilla massiliensis]